MWQCSLLRNLSQDGAECEPDLLVGSSLGQVETRRYTERGEQQHWQLLPQTDRWFAKARLYSIVKLVAFSNWIFIKVVASSRHFAFSSHLFGSRPSSHKMFRLVRSLPVGRVRPLNSSLWFPRCSTGILSRMPLPHQHALRTYSESAKMEKADKGEKTGLQSTDE